MSRPEEPGPKLELIGPASLSGFAVAGLVIGWMLRRVIGSIPQVGVVQIVTLVAVGALLLLAARAMRRAQRDAARRLSPSQAVNRLVLAKASALGGAAVAGGYVGHLLSWLGAGSEAASERMVRAGLAALAALLVMVSGLVLERACRIDDGDS